MIEIFSELIVAARMNLYFAGVSLPLGFGLALALAFGMERPRGPISFITRAFIYFFRGSPLFIQLFFFYYFVRAMGLHTLEFGPQETRVFGFVLNALFLAPFVLLLNTAAYSAVIFANALRAVPKGDLAAAEAFGFSPWKKFWRVTWPNMLRIAWPAYTNEVVFLFLATSLVYASAIPITTRPGGASYKDMFQVARDTAAQTFNPFISYLPAMALFVLMTWMIFFLTGLVNRHLNRHLKTAQRGPGLKFRPNFLR